LQVGTRGYNGSIEKRARVFTNDPLHKEEILTLKASVNPAISVSKDRVLLKGKPGEIATDAVEIRAEREKALHIDPIYYDLDKKVDYTIETVEKRRVYRIHFKNKPAPAGNFYGFMRLKTNYPERPLILLRISGRFRH